jgi:Zn-dependent protease with chaperone function
MYALLGICLTLAALFTLNAVGSAATAVVWRALKRGEHRWTASSCARLLLALRILPPAAAVVFAFGLLLPSYLLYEPRGTGETVTWQLAVISLLSAAAIVLSVWRWLTGWRATRRLTLDWLSQAEPVKFENVMIPAYRIEHRFPVIAVAGVFRQRLFVAGCIFRTLNRGEIAAAIAHETAHLTSHDNLKRSLLRICRDALLALPCGRLIDRDWAEASELAADEHAAGAGAETTLNLASALVKIARLAPVELRPAMPAGASQIGSDASSISLRVRRLARLAESPRQPAKETVLRFTPLALFVAVFFLAMDSGVLAMVHHVTEYVVRALQ